jgi:hypothetical protein
MHAPRSHAEAPSKSPLSVFVRVALGREVNMMGFPSTASPYSLAPSPKISSRDAEKFLTAPDLSRG